MLSSALTLAVTLLGSTSEPVCPTDPSEFEEIAELDLIDIGDCTEPPTAYELLNDVSCDDTGWCDAPYGLGIRRSPISHTRLRLPGPTSHPMPIAFRDGGERRAPPVPLIRFAPPEGVLAPAALAPLPCLTRLAFDPGDSAGPRPGHERRVDRPPRA